jgi:flagellar motor switch protein FliG
MPAAAPEKEKVSPIATLNKTQKLAGLLVVLGPEEAAVILSAFNQRQMEAIMTEMAKIEFLSAEVQQALLEEFSSVTLEGVTSTLGGVQKAHNVLEKSFGATKAREVIGRVAPDSAQSPMVDELRSLPASAVGQMLRGEQPQTWALILAQLEHESCAELLKTMDLGFKADVMLRMARMEPVSPDVLDRLIKGLLARRPESAARDYVSADGTKFVTEIMKKFDRQTATDALNALAESDPELSASIRKMMFIFDDLVTLDAATIGIILREIDFNTLAIAMKDCAPKFKEMVLKNITKRAAEGLQENLKMSSNVKKKEVEAARAAVMEQVFEIERRGDISLASEDANAS